MALKVGIIKGRLQKMAAIFFLVLYSMVGACQSSTPATCTFKQSLLFAHAMSVRAPRRLSPAYAGTAGTIAAIRGIIVDAKHYMAFANLGLVEPSS